MPSQRTTFRPLNTVAEALENDPIAKVNRAALIRVAIDNFIALGLEPIRGWALGTQADTKGAEATVSITVPPTDIRRYRRFAKAHGVKLGAVIQTALCHHYGLLKVAA